MELPQGALAPLITVKDHVAAGGDPRDLRIACAKGWLVRVRRGTYCSMADWSAADPRERHIIAIRAVLLDARRELVVAGASAAAVWDLPHAAVWPQEVTVLVRSTRGGTSEPGVRHTTASAASGFVTATEIGGIPVTSIARTALDVARELDFPEAVAVVDRSIAVKNRDAATKDELAVELARARYARGRAHLQRVVDFASPLSGSPGESETRAVIHLLGFEAPELQVCFVDEEGEIHPDFFWRSVRVAGESDGKVKFSREEYSHGDPVEVLWREKKREDRLRRQVARVVRILAEHVRDPRRLEQLLTEAGVPRERPGYVMRSRGARGDLPPVLDQWQQRDGGRGGRAAGR